MTSRDEGFESFAAARSGALFRTAWLLTGDWQLAEDLVQETLARIYLRWRKVSHMDNPAAYARRTLVNVHTSYRRVRRNSERPAADPSDSTAAQGHDHGRDHGDDPDVRLTLLAGLARLERTDRSVLVLRYWEDLDVNATAELLGMSAANVRTRSMRALARLREALGADLDDLPTR
ncbi:MAG: SigE family RNA polymerase sigma factor [Actinomycetales bacterium]